MGAVHELRKKISSPKQFAIQLEESRIGAAHEKYLKDVKNRIELLSKTFDEFSSN